MVGRTVLPLKGGFTVMDTIGIDGATFIGWGGAGGSAFYWSSELKIGCGYCNNGLNGIMPPEERSVSILKVLVEQARKLQL